MSQNFKLSKLSLAIFSALSIPSTLLLANDVQKPDSPSVTENFHLNSRQLGMDSPVVIGIGHSKQLGAIIDGRYNHLFNDNTAFSLGLEAGSRNYRVSGTVAHAFSEIDRAKFTAEALRQKQKYTFRSGETDEWISQRGFGVEYEHLNPGKLLSDIHVAANHVKSDSKALSDETWLSESATEFEVFNNERRIAGATRNGMLVGIGLSPRPSSQLKLDLNYDTIKYDTLLSGTAQNLSGAGTTLSWAEQLTNKTSLNLSASAREPYDRYRAQVNHRLGNQLFGQAATLRFSASHQAGKHGLEDDNRATMQLAFGGNRTKQVSRSSSTDQQLATAQNDLLAWTSQPAVYGSRVLTKVDQKASDERLVVVTKADLSAINATIDKAGDVTVSSVNGISISQVTENGSASSFSSQQFRLENGALLIGVAALNAPSVYFVSVEQANGLFSHISFATFQGSIGVSFVDVKKDQSSSNQTGSDATSQTQNGNTGSLSDVSVNENTTVSIATYQAFSGERLRFSASGLPSGLSIDSNSGAITGTTQNVVDVDSISASITVTATDNAGVATSLPFTLTILNSDRSDDTPEETTTVTASPATCTNDPLTTTDGAGVFINDIDDNCNLTSFAGANGARFVINPDGDPSLVDIDSEGGGVVFVSGNGNDLAEGAQTVVVDIGGVRYSISFDAQNNGFPSVTVSGVAITNLGPVVDEE